MTAEVGLLLDLKASSHALLHLQELVSQQHFAAVATMPLTERDVNTPRDVPRSKRHSMQRELSYARVNDENSPSPRKISQKTATSPSQRILAPTKASAAKVASSPRAASNTHQTTPQIQSHSKLPRRTPTPSGVGKFKISRRVAEPIAAHEKTSDVAEQLSKQHAEAPVVTEQAQVSGAMRSDCHCVADEDLVPPPDSKARLDYHGQASTRRETSPVASGGFFY